MKNINFLNRVKWGLYSKIILKYKAKNVGKHTMIFDPMRLEHLETMYFGNNIFISSGSWLIGNSDRNITLKIQDQTIIGNFVHIVALHSIEVQKSVMIADKVFITDSTHNYEDVSIPVKEQGMRQISNVVIGEGTWIGESVSILGCSIGKQCVIGAGSIVTKDIPDYCVAVGNPAKVIKKYSLENRKWESC